MKLRNKKTGQIIDLDYWNIATFGNEIVLESVNGEEYYCYKSLAKLNEEWEDYEPPRPLIQDEKIRKIVRSLFEVWEVEDVKIDSNKYFFVTTIEAIGKGWKLEIPSININGVFKLTELCGEEE